MSDRSAVTNKGKDGKSKYSSLNLYDTYKGKSVEPQKQAVSHGRGLQSLGKVGNARRVPTPAILPSLRSEHKGNDPNINLVPCSGSGWGADEKKPENAAPSTAPTNPTQQTPQGPAPQDDSQSAKSWHPSAPNAPLQGSQQQQHGTTQALAPAPARSAPPSRLDREFPVLGMSGDQPQPAASSSKDADPDKDKDKSKEVQYGPGPSLRPQNVKSWREGGSSLNKSGGTGTGEGEGAASAMGAALEKDRAAMPPPPPPGMAPPGILNGAQGNAQPPGPMPQFSRMMPPYMQFGPGPGAGPGPRGMPGGPGGPRMPMNPYPMGYPGPPPPRHGFPPHPGAMMPGHPGHDQRPPRHRNKPPMRNREGGGPPPAIVDVKDLSKMEEIAREKTEEGWAGASGEVDYSEKLVFSDEEDDSPKKRAEKGSKHISREPPKEGKDGRLEEDFNRRSPMTTESGPHGLPRAAWEANEKEGGTQPPKGPHPHHGRGPPNMDQTVPQRPPVDEDDERWNHQRQKQSSEMSSNIERARQRRLEEQKREDERRQAAAKEKLRQLDERSAQTRGPKQEGEDSGPAPVAASSAAPTAPREVQRADSGHELVQQENHESGEAESSSSRDREWDRDRERHKERDLERERDRERVAAVEVPFSREGMVIKRQRTESGSSDGSRQGRDRRGDAGNFARQPARNLPPRFLKQQQQQQQQEQQQQQQQQQQHRRPPPFSSQDQTWYGREGRGSWGGSGSTTPTTPPFGQENRQFTNPNARFHVQRRRESSETSLDGPDKSVFTPEGKDGLREGDVPSGQAAVPSRAEASLPGRGEADDKGNRRGSNDRGFRNQRIPSEGQPKEIPRRQDSHREIPRAPRPDVRPDQRQDQRQDHRSDQRQEHRQDHRQDIRQDPRQDPRQERRPDPRYENRPDPRRDNRPDQRWDHRQDQRPEHKPEQKQEQRHEVHQDSKQEPKPAARQESEQEAKQESRPEKKSEIRERPPVDRSISREKVSVTSNENVLDTRQSAPPKCINEPKAEASVTHVQEKKEPKEAAQPSEKDKKKESGPVAESKENIAEPSKTAKAGSNDRDRRPQRDSKAVPSSLVDMKSGNREKLERSDKPDRYEKGRRRDADRDDRSNRRGSQEQSGSRHASQKQSDSRERRKEDVQAPEPSRAWKGGDTSQRLKLNSSATTIDAHSQQGAAKEAKMDNQPSASRRNNDVSKPHIEEQRPPTESVPKELRDIQIEKGERKDTEENESGSKPKEVLNDKSRDRDHSSRDRREDGRDRGGRTGGRGRGSVDANRRRDDRGPPSRRDERGPPSGTSSRRERGRFEAGSSHGRGFKTYSAGVRGRGRGRGERYDSRQGYRRPRHREEEEEDWDASSGDESADRAQERKEAPRQNKPTEVKDVPEGNGPSTPSEEKPPVSKDKTKEPEAKGETAAAADGPEVDSSERDSPDRRSQVPRGEPSRRGRGASLGRRGRGGNGRGGASRDQGREFYSRDERDSGRPDRPRDGSQRNDRGQRNDWEMRDGREFRGRGREEDERRMRSDRRDGPPGRGDRDPYKGSKRAKPERPPRFQKSPRGGRGTGRVRSARGERMPEASGNRGREPGDQNNQVSGGSPNDVSKGAARPPLPRQNSSDLNNDEWETASESSNFNDHRQRDKEISQEGPKGGSDKVVRESSSGNPRSSGGNPENRNRNDRRDSGRKGPPNQRQGGDRPNNRDRPDYDRREKSFRGSGRDNRGPSSRGGRGRGSDRRQDNGPIGKRPGGPKGGSEHAHNNQNHSSDVYRLDTILLDDQRGVHDALSAVTMRPKKGSMPMGKPLDTTTPVNLPLQTKERERPKQIEKKIDVLATYDINNSYGVVVVDDVPEVIVENPEELLTPDAGFQPVLSKKQKAAESERKKQESLSEMSKRSKLGTQMKRNTKLPPRLRGQSPIKEPSTVAPIGTGPRMGTLNKAPGTKPISTDNIPPLIGPGSIIIPPPSLGKSGVESLPLAPPPPSNAWDKPPILSGPQPPLVAAPPAAPIIPASKAGPGVPGKPESSSDQHDSGVELNSDHHASNPPSQRSSPNGEAKAEARLVSELMSAVGQQSKHSPLTSQSDWSTDMAPSSRLSGVGLQSVNEVAVSSYVSVSGGMMGRMEGVVTQAKDSGMRNLAVDMVASSGVIGPNSLLAQSPSGRAGQSSIISSQDQNRSNVQSPTSTAATDELIKKMERAKNLWDEQEEGTPQISLGNGNLSSQALSSMTSVTAGDNDQQLQTQPQQQHISRGDERGTMGDLGSSHLSHPANSMLPASGTSDITFGSFASSNVELVENDAPTSVSFTSLNANMSANIDPDDIDMSVPSSRSYAQFSSANTEVESPPEIFTSAGYSSKGLSLYTSAATGSSFAPGALLQSGYETKHYGGEQARMHPQHTQQQSQQQQQQQQEQSYQQSVLLAQPFNLGSSLGTNLAGSAVGIAGGSLSANIGGTSQQSMLSQGTSGQYSFQGPDTSRLLPASPAFLNPVSFQGTIIQPQSAGSLQYGLNQNAGMAPASPAPGAAPSQQTHQSYQQAAAAGFLPTQTPQSANFAPILSVSLSQQPHMQSHSYLSLSSPSYTRPNHDLGLSAGLSSGLTSSVIMKPQATMGGLTKTVSSVAYGSVSTVPAVQPSHIFSQRATSQLGAQQPGMTTTNTLIAAAMQPSATPAMPQAAYHPTQGQHTSFFSGGAQVAAANSQVGSTNFFNTLQGSRTSSLQPSVQAIQPLPIQLPQSTISSQYSMAAQGSQQTTQPIVHPIGAPLGGYVNTYGDIGTQPKQLHRNVPSGFGIERQASSILDMTSDLLSARGSDATISRSSNLSQHVDAKPFSPNRQTNSVSSTYGAYNKPQDDRYGAYTSRASGYKSHEQVFTTKPVSYSAVPLTMGYYSMEDRNVYSQPKTTITSYSQAKATSSYSQPRTTTPTFSQPPAASESPMSSVADSAGLPVSEPASVSASTASSKQSSLPYSMSTATVTTASGTTSQKPIYMQASQVITSQPPSKPISATTKGYTVTSTPPAMPQSLPPRGFPGKVGMNTPRMPPQMFGQPTPRMMSHMLGIAGQQMRYPPPFPQGPPPPRGAQFGPPPRLPTAASAGVNLPPSPPNPPTNLQVQKSSQAAPKSQSQRPSSSVSQGSTTTQGRPPPSGQSSFQANKSKSLQGLPGPSKLSKAPSHFSRRAPIDLKMTPEELKAARDKDRENLLASTKAFFSKGGSEADLKEKSEKK